MTLSRKCRSIGTHRPFPSKSQPRLPLPSRAHWMQDCVELFTLDWRNIGKYDREMNNPPMRARADGKLQVVKW